MKKYFMFVFFFAFTFVVLVEINSTLADQEIGKEEVTRQKDQKRLSIDDKEKFSLVYESLKDIYSDYETDAMKTLAFLIICIGWLINSDKTRDFIQKNRSIKVSAIAVLAVTWLIHINASSRAYVASQNRISMLSNLNYLDLKFFQNYEITIEHLLSNLMQNTVLFALPVFLLLLMKVSNSKSL